MEQWLFSTQSLLVSFYDVVSIAGLLTSFVN